MSLRANRLAGSEAISHFTRRLLTCTGVRCQCRRYAPRNDGRNCILPIQFYAIMKATYAGGKYSHAQSHTRSTHHTASADVVFACLYRRNHFGKPCFAFDLGLDFAHSFCHLSSPSFASTCATFACFVSPSSVRFYPFYCSLPGHRAVSNVCSKIRCLPHRLLQRP